MDPHSASGSSQPSGLERTGTHSNLERVLLVFRAPPEWAGEVTATASLQRAPKRRPGGVRPRLWRDQPVLVLAYSFFGRRRRWFGARHHLVYHMPITAEGPRGHGAPGEALSSLILRRESSAWLATRWQAALAKPAPIRSRFALEQRGSALDLTVERPDAERFNLRVHRATGWRPGLFLSRQELAAFLGSSSPSARPASPTGLMAPDLGIEPAVVEEASGLLPFDRTEGFDLECAVRLRPVLMAPVLRTSQSREARGSERPTAAPA